MVKHPHTHLMFLALFLALTSAIHAVTCGVGAGLNDTGTTTRGGINWIVTYTDDTSSVHYTPPSDAEDFADFIEDLYDRQVGDYAFKKPWSSTLPDFKVALYDFVENGDGDYSGVYDGGGDCFALNVDKAASPPNTTDQKVTAHEMFHGIQERYIRDGGSSGIIGTWGSMIAEGHARCMDDRWFTEYDTVDDGSSLFLQGAAGIFLNDYTDFDFWKIATDEDNARSPGDPYPYATGIFWSYLCEQLGNQITPLGNGYDWIKEFLEKSETLLSNGDDVDGKIATNKTIQQFSRGSGENFESLYFDFAICNYARIFDQTQLPDEIRYRQSNLVPRYAYRDETETGDSGSLVNYGSVPVNSSNAAGGATFNNESLMAHSAKYYEWNLTGGLDVNECAVIGVKATASESMNFGILGITQSGKILDLVKYSGTEAARCYLVASSTSGADRIARIALVAAAKDRSVNELDIEFDAGPANLQIISPSNTSLAYPGPATDPENILVRVKVLGPLSLTPSGAGDLSVKGLIEDDFTVEVNSIDAPVKSAAYVGGEYWLVVQAPMQAADGLYVLDVALCENNYTDTKALSVLYGDYTFRHAVCMDLSGSMDYPSTKLDAAKQSALFYVDTVKSSDRFGLVSFAGDGVEPGPVDDAVAIGSTMFDANDVTRFLLKAGITVYTAGGGTSIGDGLSVSQDIIDADPTPGPLIDTILLLSDGVQNEDLTWGNGTSIRNRFVGGGGAPGNDTIINTIAFGPDADTNLMSDIATSTGGQPSSIEVDVPPAPISGVAALTAPSASMFLRLGRSYLGGSEKAQRSERLVYREGTIAAGASDNVKLDLADVSVEDGMFYIFWEGTAGALDVSLYDPDSNLIEPPKAEIYPADYSNNERHRTWQMLITLDPGVYTLDIKNQTGIDTPFFAGISGRPKNALKCHLAFSSFLRPELSRPEDSLRHRFGIGQPVTIKLFLTDRDGAVRDAEVEVLVQLPNRQEACGPVKLFDDGQHDDGLAGDGVYGNVFRQTLWGQSRGGDRDKGEPGAPPEASGAYQVFISAAGKANDGTAFSREKDGAFTVYREIEPNGFDDDGDGLPNSWERYQGTNPKVNDAGEDPDEDGLTNEAEYKEGTLALDPDTDNGGESDGSELMNGRCPLDSRDDGLSFSDYLTVLGPEADEVAQLLPPKPRTNYVHFTRSRSWDLLELQRATTPSGPWANVKMINMSTIDLPVLEDGGLIPGIDYYYRMRGQRNDTGATSGWSTLAKGRPKSANEVFKPFGSLSINNGAVTTDQLKVMLHLSFSPDVVAMRVAQRPGIGSAPQEPALRNRILSLAAGTPPGPVTIDVEFIDGDGYVSDIISDTIIFDPSTSANPDDDGDKISDSDEVFVFFTDPNQPDTDGDGCDDGDEIDRGTLPLIKDTDGDQLSDGEEKIAMTDPNDRDSDDDGYSDYGEVTLLKTDPNDQTDQLDVEVENLGAASDSLTFLSKPGVTYHFCVSDDAVNWIELPDTVTATDTETTVTLTIPPPLDESESRRFFLVKVKRP
jgi:hypothetical protein